MAAASALEFDQVAVGLDEEVAHPRVAAGLLELGSIDHRGRLWLVRMLYRLIKRGSHLSPFWSCSDSER